MNIATAQPNARPREAELLSVATRLFRERGYHATSMQDLAEALALAHDLGHTPFGHAGEDALNAEMQPFGGFSHNDQTLRILTRLERHYAEFDGLNLTWETLEGLVKHNGPLTDREGKPLGRYREHGVPETILHYARLHDLQLWSLPGVEAQLAAVDAMGAKATWSQFGTPATLIKYGGSLASGIQAADAEAAAAEGATLVRIGTALFGQRA